MDPDWDSIARALERGLVTLDRVAIHELTARWAQEPTRLHFVEKAIPQALEHIGIKWEEGDLALSQVYMSARLCEQMLQAALPEGNLGLRERPLLGLGVLLDHHALGKRIVHAVLRSTGYRVLDYGQGATPESLVERALADGIDVLLVSVLMHSSALKVREIRRLLDARGSRVKVVVGGAPFSFAPRLWQEVGADAMGTRASEAPALVESVLGGPA